MTCQTAYDIVAKVLIDKHYIEVHYHVFIDRGDISALYESHGTLFFGTRRFGPKMDFFSCTKTNHDLFLCN